MGGRLLLLVGSRTNLPRREHQWFLTSEKASYPGYDNAVNSQRRLHIAKSQIPFEIGERALSQAADAELTDVFLHRGIGENQPSAENHESYAGQHEQGGHLKIQWSRVVALLLP